MKMYLTSKEANMNFQNRFSIKMVFLQSYLLFFLLQFLFLPVASQALLGQNKGVV
jgi:hypothetical protein